MKTSPKSIRSSTATVLCMASPALWGIAGIVWDTKLVDTQVSSWDILWDETYKGKVVMPATARECAAVALKRQGKDVNTTDKTELEDAYKLLEEQKDLAAGYTSRVAYTMMTTNPPLWLWLTPVPPLT